MAVQFQAGTASIKISPDLTGFHRRVKTQLRAERVEAPVIIVPDMSRFKQELTAKLSNVTAKIKVEVAPDLTNFSQQLRTRLGAINANLRVQVTPDFSGFAADLHSHLGASAANITIPVDLDFTRAREQLLLFRLEASHAMRADFDLDITAALAQLAALHAASQGIGNSAGGCRVDRHGGHWDSQPCRTCDSGACGIGCRQPHSADWPTRPGGRGYRTLACNGCGQRRPALQRFLSAPLASSMLSRRAPRLPRIAAKNAAKTAKQQATEARERASAAKAVANAERGVEKAADGVARAQRGVGNALDNVERAERGVIQAQKKSEDAQKSLTRARKDAQEQIEDLNLALKGSALDERGAELAVRRAEQQLRDLWKGGQPVTQLDISEAVLGVDEAKQRLDEVRERNGDLREEVDAANKAGVEGSEQVVSAKEAIADADQGVIDSQKSLADSHLAVADAQGAVLDAQRNFTDAQEAVIEAQVRASEVTSANADAVDEYAAALANLSPECAGFCRADPRTRRSMEGSAPLCPGRIVRRNGGEALPTRRNLHADPDRGIDLSRGCAEQQAEVGHGLADDGRRQVGHLADPHEHRRCPGSVAGWRGQSRSSIDGSLRGWGLISCRRSPEPSKNGTGSFADMIHEMRTTIDDQWQVAAA